MVLIGVADSADSTRTVYDVAVSTNGQKLNPRQQAFVNAYLEKRNATAAALTAGYSEKTARQAGSRLLTRVDIKSALRARERGALARLEVTEDMTLEELAAIAFVKPTDVVTWEEGGEMIVKSSSEIPPHLVGAIKSVEEVVTVAKNKDGSRIYETTRRKVTFHNKLDALKLLAEYQGLTDSLAPKVQVYIKTGIDRTPLPVDVEAEEVVEKSPENRVPEAP